MLMISQLGEIRAHMAMRVAGDGKWERLGLFALVGWHIWKARNDWVFDKVAAIPMPNEMSALKALGFQKAVELARDAIWGKCF
ncbi:hypothetical protein RHGRI_026748 [Rhododendron griersonianum]|uniref:Uncharacterized protein n=1 Tax=Rhododendron griersonianum TaxID=479676 RepID=A0AAV6IV06_9ERIC|nr:hypothetical protein RHGRI_026748 [Rhododendron griersonianum]